MSNDFRDVRHAIAKSVAAYDVGDEVVDVLTENIIGAELPVRRLDVCVYGICIDYFFDRGEWAERLQQVMKVDIGLVRELEVFPYGIPWPDIFHVRVTHQLEGVQVRG